MSLEAFRQKILPLREQAALRNRWLRERLDTVIPALMAREQIDMWLVVAREYNEDPVIMTLLPAPAMSARRRTILAFARNPDGSVHRFSIDRYGHDDFYQSVWRHGEETQYEALLRIVKERNPQTIGVNTSGTFAFGDGLTHQEQQNIVAALGEDLAQRITSAEELCVGWLETRTEPEITAYPALIEIGHTLISEAFSTKVIHPGITHTHDVVWWMRQRMQNMGLQAWFQPDVEIQAPGQTFETEEQRTLILPGDLLWCDVGFYYLGLATDQQQNAYVLKPGEIEAPQGLQAALAQANHLQDIHMSAMQVGRTGNEILADALGTAQSAQINAQIYSHPLGYHGHAAGPTIGLWDQQGGVPGKGDYPVYDNTAYSIELNIAAAIPEWDNQLVRIRLEEDAVMHDGQMHWLHGRQEQFHLIG